jgi:glutathione S-transferase
MKLVIGNRNFSSWSLRPWLVMEAFGLPREEEVVPLDQPDTAARIAAISGAGRVPVLLDGALAVWDSLAICEYLAERFPEKGLWPRDPAARAVARSACAEMHSGFQALREACPMKFKETFPPRPLPPEVQANVDRIAALWEDCRRRFGQGGPFLFGAFSVADAFYGPVVSRFRTYGIPLGGAAAAYAEAMWKHPAMQKWLAAAQAETFQMKRYG